MEPVNAYLAEKTKTETEFPLTLFHVIVAALIKTITLRPKMNRFIANKNIYQRNEVSAAFVVKKQFSDDGAEALAFVHAADDDTIDSVHQNLRTGILLPGGDKANRSTDSMDILNKMPRFFAKFLVWIITKLDKHGKCPRFSSQPIPTIPQSFCQTWVPSSFKCGYHHLTNWGTNSVFCIIGEKEKCRPARRGRQRHNAGNRRLWAYDRRAHCRRLLLCKTIRLLKTAGKSGPAGNTGQ